MKKINLPTLAEVKAEKVNLAQLEAYAAAIKKPPTAKSLVNDEYRRAMHEAIEKLNERIRDVMKPIAEWHERDRVHFDAYFEFWKILQDSLQNPVIEKSSKATKMVKLLVELFGKVIYYKFNDLEEVLKPVIEPAVKREKSKQTSDASTASHRPRAEAKKETLRLFMSKKGEWDSISEAVEEIAPIISNISKKSPGRKMSNDNSHRTIREWISAYIHADKSAYEKLTPNAQRRLKKAPAKPEKAQTTPIRTSLRLIKGK